MPSYHQPKDFSDDNSKNDNSYHKLQKLNFLDTPFLDEIKANSSKNYFKHVSNVLLSGLDEK